MSNADALKMLPVDRTPLGFEYIIMAEVPQPWRVQYWQHISKRRAALFVSGVGEASLIQDWREWLNSLWSAADFDRPAESEPLE